MRIYQAIIAVSVVVFCISLVMLIRTWKEYKDAQDSYQAVIDEAMGGDKDRPLVEPDTETETPEENQGETAPEETKSPVLRYTFNGNTQALKAQNPDFIGWIFVPGTSVSYPMVQAEDNDYYLRRTFERQDNPAGCIFLDYRIKAGLDAKNPIIYGHNRKDGSMFAGMKKYEKESFFQKYPYIHIFTTEGDRIYQVFSVYVTEPVGDTYTYGFGSDASFLRYIEKMKSQSLYDTGVEVSAEDTILTLVTCTNRQADTRFIVQAKRIQ